MLSDQGFGQTFAPGSSDSYLSSTLPRQGELIEDYYAVAGSELASRIALISGQGPTPQTTANCPTFAAIRPGTKHRLGQLIGKGCVYPPATDTLPDELTAAHHSWKAYIEGIDEGPHGLATSCRHPKLGGTDGDHLPRPGDPYATWTNPFVYFRSLTAASACQKSDVGLDQLASDLKTAAKAPTFAFIAPSPCDDGSDQPCAPKAQAGLLAADKFLRSVVPEIERSPAYKDNGLIAITFDEAPQSGPHADPSACCNTPKYPNLPATSSDFATAAELASTPTDPAGATTTPTDPAGATTTTTSGQPTISTTTNATTTTTTSAATTATTTTTSAAATTPTPAAPTTTTSPTTTTTTTTSTTATPPAAGTGVTSPTGGGGQVGLLLISRYVKPGSTDLVDYYNHFSLLATIENLFGVKRLGYAGDLQLPVFDASIFNGH